MKSKFVYLMLATLCFNLVVTPNILGVPEPRPDIKQAQNLHKNGNYKDALEICKKILTDKTASDKDCADALASAADCLTALNMVAEIDDLFESAVASHTNNYQLLSTAADRYIKTQHRGYIIAGKFQRGYHRGRAKRANSYERDRVRAMQLLQQARTICIKNKLPVETAKIDIQFAAAIARPPRQSWKLLQLTDLTQLPDYEKRYYYHSDNRYAPADASGNPIFHALPQNYSASRTDGERWRFLLTEAKTMDPQQRKTVTGLFANFSYSQFSVHTLSEYNWFFRALPSVDSDSSTRSAALKLDSLTEDETIAKLATGIKRFTLPDEWNYIKLYRSLATGDNPTEDTFRRLANIFENRRQYDAALGWWKNSIKKFGDSNNHWKQKRIDQIVGDWGLFESVSVFPAGTNATVEFRFRNATNATFTAHAIKTEKLLEDVKNYLKENPLRLKYNKTNLRNIGYRLLRDDGKKYIGKEVARWTEPLTPADKHFDRRVTIKTPLKNAGAWLLTADIGKNTSSIIIWIANTSIIEKKLDGKMYYFVADAVTGKPIPDAKLEFFGYRTKYIQAKRHLPGSRRQNIETIEFTEKTNVNGEVIPSQKLNNGFQWLITASVTSSNTPVDNATLNRFAYLGFNNIWCKSYNSHHNAHRKAFIITDRPVYRPGQNVKYKIWLRRPDYNTSDSSAYANKSYTLRILAPQNKKILEQTIKTDDYGGFNSEISLPQDAALGVYSIYVVNFSSSNFRVEEYKKPEFEVKIDAPAKPVMLGDKISATLKANYYFGAPVTDAKVKIKIERSTYRMNWYPVDPWDWLYGNGYWWFGYDYDWYPGWYKWGCLRPSESWFHYSHNPPELVAESEQRIGKDGTLTIDIDTAIAKAMHGDQDHRYTITAEVTDKSRRTIVGSGSVIAARAPFKIYAWSDRGYYRVGDTVKASFSARTPDSKPISNASGKLTLYRLTYTPSNHTNAVNEHAVAQWPVTTDADGRLTHQLAADKAGQYRITLQLTDAAGHSREGAHIFTVIGNSKTDAANFNFNAIELVPDKRHYKVGQKVKLRVNTARVNSTVLLFLRPRNGVYHKPQLLRIDGKSREVEIPVTKDDMPNFFIEAITISNGKVHSTLREIAVPPEKRIINIAITPSAKKYKPGQKAKVKVRLTDSSNMPIKGSTVISIYDKAVEYISGGSNVPNIKAFFWEWRHHHTQQTHTSLNRHFRNLVPPKHQAMSRIGVFGNIVVSKMAKSLSISRSPVNDKSVEFLAMGAPAELEDSLGGEALDAPMACMSMGVALSPENKQAAPAPAPVTIRKNFADTAYWNANLTPDPDGYAEISLTMPENLSTWKIRSWAMGNGTRVGQAAAEVVTFKKLLLRMQAPRFFVERDIVVLSANIHNYLDSKKEVKAVLELDGQLLEPMDPLTQTVSIAPNSEARVNWRVRALREGEAVIRMKAITDEESDAMQMNFPVYVHGMLKTESFSGAIRPDKQSASINITVPRERRIDNTKLEIRYSPSLAGAMVDALPYLTSYPYGCTEQTLNRFVPTVITQNILKKSGFDLDAIRTKRTNLNAQEIGDDKQRAQQWQRDHLNKNGKDVSNPVFDKDEIKQMIAEGIRKLQSMQNGDGGWGWFYGNREYSYAHTTATVVHGLITAKANGADIPQNVIENGLNWLRTYQKEQIKELTKLPTQDHPDKAHADNLDALVFATLVEAGTADDRMREFLYRDRNNLSIYAKTLFALALHTTGQQDQLAMLTRNIEQYLKTDSENQTAWLNLQNGNFWWYWYGCDIEAQAAYLKLLSRTDPKNPTAAGLAKYIINNRRHATYWNSTRDTALAIEALAEYMLASGENKPDMTVEVFVDGVRRKSATINTDNLFTFDNNLVLKGRALTAGKHTIELRRTGSGPLYFNAYLTNFTLKDHIKKTGLEIKVQRKIYKLIPDNKTTAVSGSRGQVIHQNTAHFSRKELADYSIIKSGDLIEVELEIDSKNDYEYILFEDMKAAGFEAVNLQSGYVPNDIGAYIEFRDNRVAFFVRQLARGKHSVSYRLRAEIPGTFSALPAKASAMYAPELKANSNEIKLTISD